MVDQENETSLLDRYGKRSRNVINQDIAAAAIDLAVAEVKALPITEEIPSIVADLGQLGGEAIVKYCEAAAQAVMQSAQQVLNTANSIMATATILADDMRHMANLQAKSIIEATAKAKVAALAVNKARDEFHAPPDAPKPNVEFDEAIREKPAEPDAQPMFPPKKEEAA